MRRIGKKAGDDEWIAALGVMSSLPREGGCVFFLSGDSISRDTRFADKLRETRGPAPEGNYEAIESAAGQAGFLCCCENVSTLGMQPIDIIARLVTL